MEPQDTGQQAKAHLRVGSGLLSLVENNPVLALLSPGSACSESARSRVVKGVSFSAAIASAGWRD
jgi:hypothetical protein